VRCSLNEVAEHVVSDLGTERTNGAPAPFGEHPADDEISVSDGIESERIDVPEDARGLGEKLSWDDLHFQKAIRRGTVSRASGAFDRGSAANLSS
jgi:hypothetical protein